MTRDTPFDEECPERSDTYREQVGEPCSLADLEAARRRWAANLDGARERLTRKAAQVMRPRKRYYTITSLASDGSSATTVLASDREEALHLFAEDNGYQTFADYLADTGASVDDLAVHMDERFP